jgi:3-dehydroquinate dehydratase/shikimate dehydrogenase
MSTLLFGVIAGIDVKSSEALLELARPFIDGIELRLDYFKDIDKEALKVFILRCNVPVMFTIRRNDQGGHFLGVEKERLDLLESLCELGPAYVDLEYDVPGDFRKRLFESYPKILFLSSYHDFLETPTDLEEIYKQIKTPYAHVYKIAVTAKSSVDVLKVLSFVQAHADLDKIIGIAMGEEGVSTRILAPVVGSFLAYAAVSSTDLIAPGQLLARELQQIYRFCKLNRQTGIYCLIGDPVDKSLGAIIHNAVFDAAGLNAVYIRMRVKKEEISAFFSLASALPFKGFSVTMPHKEVVMPLLAQISIQARVIGACNTIKVAEHNMTGYNTDGIGALNAIERRNIVFGKHVVFVGAGGAARSLIFEAVQRGAYVTVINRTPEKAIEIAKSFGGTGGGWELFPKVCEMGYDVIVACIPESEVIEEQWILTGKIAMDIVYIPKNTPFLVKASRKKCQIVFGYEMFIGQALEQERVWFPEEINFDRAFAIIEEKVTSVLA